nr:flotillin-like protein 3 [Tanacetum cinerariifolium]
MSADKLPFILPVEFVIGPRTNDKECLYKYAKLTSCQEKDTNITHIHELVNGTIKGQTRVLAASITMEEISRGTKKFKKEVFDKVQLELCQFGLLIYNASIKELVDVPGQEYFSYLGLKTQMEAANEAKKDVYEANMMKKMNFLLFSMNVVYVLTTLILEDGGDDATVKQITKRNKWDNNDYVCRGLILKEYSRSVCESVCADAVMKYYDVVNKWVVTASCRVGDAISSRCLESKVMRECGFDVERDAWLKGDVIGEDNYDDDG